LRRDWSTAEIEKLETLYGEGFSLHDIASQLSRSYASVKTMIQRLGLERPRQSQAEKTVLIDPIKPSEKRLDSQQIDLFLDGIVLRLQSGPLSLEELRVLELGIKAALACMKRYI